MPLEIFNLIEDLVVTNPLGTDPKSQGDDHIRGLKETLVNQFPVMGSEAVNLTAAELNGFVGMVAAFPIAPGLAAGWLLCDGQEINRIDQSNLFTFLGITYGPGDGSLTFNLPDYRGQFLRGQDQGAAEDPDAATRTDRGDGTTGDEIGTKQDEEVGPHNHDFRWQDSGGDSNENYHQTNVHNTNFSIQSSLPVVANTGSETRPKNINVQYFIHI